MRMGFLLTSAVGLAVFATSASAATFVVEAQANSSSGGSALDTGISLSTGQLFTVSSSVLDLWSAGALPRYSDANGLIAPRLAVPGDDSGQPAGTLIGTSFGVHTQGGYSAPFGSLVGRLGGTYQLLGANFAGPAWNTGSLELFYWDSNSFDNFGEITFEISAARGAVPELSTWAMLLLGFGAIGGALRSRRRKSLTVSYT